MAAVRGCACRRRTLQRIEDIESSVALLPVCRSPAEDVGGLGGKDTFGCALASKRGRVTLWRAEAFLRRRWGIDRKAHCRPWFEPTYSYWADNTPTHADEFLLQYKKTDTGALQQLPQP
jgi:hypothetical protein